MSENRINAYHIMWLFVFFDLPHLIQTYNNILVLIDYFVSILQKKVHL